MWAQFVNKVDILQSNEEREQVLSFVNMNVSSRLQTQGKVPIFPVSARMALESKILKADADKMPMQDGGVFNKRADMEKVATEKWERSGVNAVESHLKKQLGKEELVSMFVLALALLY